MLNMLFLQILDMSITASYVILIVLVIRFFLTKMPKIFSYALWFVVLFRLTCPFSWKSNLSWLILHNRSANIIPSDQSQPVLNGFKGANAVDVSNFSVPMAHSGNESIGKMDFSGIWGDNIVTVLWLAGMILLAAYSLISLVRLKMQLQNAVCDYDNDNVYLVESLNTPFVMGIIQPKIYIPAQLSGEEKKYILLHEQTHLKRYDHLIKIISFFILCIHWFNPLCWLAFFLSGKDMEMSCDESVIKQIGNQGKKNYSQSLLSMATGKKIVGGTPLAFGEGNTRDRIKNILNYKKPGFWLIVLLVFVISAAGIGLSTDPKEKIKSIKDYAQGYISKEIEAYENAEYQNITIVDQKIIRLEQMSRFEEIMEHPIELWRLEYRLKPDDINKVVLAGGMNEIDGWLTEDSSMGKPILVFSMKKTTPQFLGVIWSGEMADTLASQEVSVRQFLESMDLLPQETYKGNHIVVKFPLSTGEISQLFMSQPAVQGKKGIWCVERWMDGNGYIYHAVPETDLLINDYYKALQEQCDKGQRPDLLNPTDVALTYINETLGQHAVDGNLEIKTPADLKDFLKTPESTYIGFVSDFNLETDMFHLDPIEWITEDNEERIKQLNLSEKDMPNGYYIYNPYNYPHTFEVNKDTEYSFINWSGEFGSERNYKTKDMKELLQYLKTYKDGTTPPFWIVTKDGYVKSITEQYVP